MNYKQFRHHVIGAFPFVLTLNVLFFAIVIIDYLQEPNAVVGAVALIFGASALVGIILAPKQGPRPRKE